MPESGTPVLVSDPAERNESFCVISQRIYPPFQVVDVAAERLSTRVIPVPNAIVTPSRAVTVEVEPLALLARTIEVFPESGKFPEIILLV